MKLRANQLSSHTQQCQKSHAWQPLYIVSSDEPLLLQEAADQLRHGVKADGFSEREVFHVEANFTWSDVLDNVNSMSLFGDRKCIELRFNKAKFDDKAKKALTQYLENPNPDTVILLLIPKLDKRTLSTQWFKTLETHCALCQIWPIDSKQLPQWIGQRLIKAGFQPNEGAKELLANRVQGNLLAAAQEIDKLTLFIDPGPIDEATIERCVTDQARYDLFELVDAAVSGQLNKALSMLHFHRASGCEPTLILWALAKEIRALSAISHQLQQGMSLNKAFRDQRVWDSRQPILRRALDTLSITQLHQLLRIANHTDNCIKGQGQDCPWSQFEQILVILGGKSPLNLKSLVN